MTRSTPPNCLLLNSLLSSSSPKARFKRRTLHVPKLIIRFGTCKVRRFESIRFDRFVFGSTCRSIRPGLSNRTAKDRLRFKRRTLTCAESNAYVTNTLNTLIFTQSSARILFLSCVHSLFWSFGTKWRDELEDTRSSCFDSTKYTCLMCINHFCMSCFIFEDNESSEFESRQWRTASHVFERKWQNKWILKKPTSGTNWTSSVTFELWCSFRNKQ